MDAGIFVVSFGTAFYVLGRLGRKQAAKAVKKADTKVRSAAEEREAARKSADLTIRQLGNEKLAAGLLKWLISFREGMRTEGFRQELPGSGDLREMTILI